MGYGGRPRWSGQADKVGARRMARLKEQGLSYTQIGECFGVSARMVRYYLGMLRKETR